MQRNSLGGARKVPGPGAYMYRELMGNEAPKFTLIGKPKALKLNTSVPGSNAYGNVQIIQSKSAAYRYLTMIKLKVWKRAEE